MSRRRQVAPSPQWIAQQARAYVTWANTYLSQRGLAINDIHKDLQDGVLFFNLVEILAGSSLGKIHPHPANRFHKLNNISKVLNFLEDAGLGIYGIAAEEIVTGSLKWTLALLWALIRHYQLLLPLDSISSTSPSLSPSSTATSPSAPSTPDRYLPSHPPSSPVHALGLRPEESPASPPPHSPTTARTSLLQWVADDLANSHPSLRIADFSKSFADGSALIALIANRVPLSAIPNVQSYSPDNPKEASAIISSALSAAQAHLGVPALLDPSDFLSSLPPAEEAVMTYVSYFPVYDSSKPLMDSAKKALNFAAPSDPSSPPPTSNGHSANKPIAPIPVSPLPHHPITQNSADLPLSLSTTDHVIQEPEHNENAPPPPVPAPPTKRSIPRSPRSSPRQLKALKAKIEQQEVTLAALRQELAASTEALTGARAATASAVEDAARARGALEAAHAETGRVMEKARKADMDAAEARGRAQALSTEVKTLRNTVNEHSGHMDVERAKRAAAVREAESAQREAFEAAEKIALLQNDLSAAQTTAAKGDAALTRIAALQSSLEEESATRLKAEARMRTAVADLETSTTQYEAQVADLTGAIEVLHDEKEDMTQRISALELKVLETEEREQSVRAELSAAQAGKADLQASIDSTDSLIQAKIQDLQAQLAAALEAKETSQAALEESRQALSSLATLEETLAQVTTERDALQSSLSDAQASSLHAQNLQTSLEELTREKDAALAALDEVKAEAEESTSALQSSLQAMEHERDEVKSALLNAQVAASEAQAELQILKDTPPPPAPPTPPSANMVPVEALVQDYQKFSKLLRYPQRRGVLLAQDPVKWNVWKSKWVLLKSGFVFIYTDEPSYLKNRPELVFDLSSCTITVVPYAAIERHNVFLINSQGTAYNFCAPSPEDADLWAGDLATSVSNYSASIYLSQRMRSLASQPGSLRR